MIINQDFLLYGETIPDKSVDLILCDLPYNQTNRDYDKNVIDLDKMWILFKRILKDDKSPVIFFTTTKFGINLIASNPKWFRYDLVWNKTHSIGHLSANKMPMRNHEMIYVFSKTGARYYRFDKLRSDDTDVETTPKPENIFVGWSPGIYGLKARNLNWKQDYKYCVSSCLKFQNIQRPGRHSFEKPQDLYEWLIKRYSKENDVVFDPTAGSFNSGIVCKRLNRQYIGCEIEKKWYDLAVPLDI